MINQRVKRLLVLVVLNVLPVPNVSDGAGHTDLSSSPSSSL